MKQTPELSAAQEQMRPGFISRDGFLAPDRRPLRAILEEDEARVAALGLTHQAIAERLRHFTEAAKARLGAPLVLEEVYEVRADDARGPLPCPWPHPGTFAKTNIRLCRLDTGEALQWTELHIHLIEAHGFYQGVGSAYRLSPETLQRVLEVGETERQRK